jgi:hypothetical protein
MIHLESLWIHGRDEPLPFPPKPTKLITTVATAPKHKPKRPRPPHSSASTDRPLPHNLV